MPEAAAELAAVGAVVTGDAPGRGAQPGAGARRRAGGADRSRNGGGRPWPPTCPRCDPASSTVLLAAAPAHPRSFVRDAAGHRHDAAAGPVTRTTCGRCSGPGSAARHAGSGAVEVDSAPAALLRRDVDTAADLDAAAALGVGAGPAGLLDGGHGSRQSARPGRIASDRLAVQATVRSFDPATRSGTVLLDDGIELPYDAAAFDAGALRLLRSGQRVRVEVHDDGGVRRVTYLTIATLPDRR